MFVAKEELARLADNSLEKKLLRVTSAIVSTMEATHGEVRVLATYEAQAIVLSLREGKAYQVAYSYQAGQVQVGAVKSYGLGVYQASEVEQYIESASRRVVDDLIQGKPVIAQLTALDEAIVLRKRTTT